MTHRLLRHLASLLAVLALAIAAGCGDDDEGNATTAPPPPPPASAPATVPSAPETTPSAPVDTSTTPTTLPTDTTGSTPTAPVDTSTAPSTPPATPGVQSYRDQANAICRTARVESQELLTEVIQSGGEPSDDLVRRLIDGTAGVRDGLAGVEPPPELADAHQRMLGTYGQVVDRLNALFDERGADALDAAGADAELNRLGQQLGQSWQELGLPECAMG